MKTVFVRAGLGPIRSLASLTRLSVTGLVLAFLFSATSSLAGQPASQHYLDDVKALSAPEMEGRGDGTYGLTRAAQLIEKRFRSLGLQPAGTDSYFQPFTVVTGARLRSGNAFQVQNSSATASLKLDQDFVPFSFSSSGSTTASAVFVGYGASAQEFNYDDYDGIDVRNKIVVLLRYEPPGFVKNRSGLTQHAELITKAINARNHGARGVVILNGRLQNGQEDLLTRFGMVSGPADGGILVVQARNAVAESWFQAAGKSLADIQNQINTTGK